MSIFVHNFLHRYCIRCTIFEFYFYIERKNIGDNLNRVTRGGEHRGKMASPLKKKKKTTFFTMILYVFIIYKILSIPLRYYIIANYKPATTVRKVFFFFWRGGLSDIRFYGDSRGFGGGAKWSCLRNCTHSKCLDRNHNCMI